MYVTRLKSFLLAYFVINLVISKMCFASAVGNWPSCRNTVASRKMRIVACFNRCNSKPMGAFNSIPVEMLEIPHLPNGTKSTRPKPRRVWLLFLLKSGTIETTILLNARGHFGVLLGSFFFLSLEFCYICYFCDFCYICKWFSDIIFSQLFLLRELRKKLASKFLLTRSILDISVKWRGTLQHCRS